MNVGDARALIAPAIPAGGGGTWADLGAGGGTFTRALLSLLEDGARVYAVDRDAASVAALARIEGVTAVRGDFTHAADVRPTLDGALLANALHFVPHDEQAGVLRRLAEWVRPGGRVVLVEYERTVGTRWVPWPVSFARFVELARQAGLAAPVSVGKRNSEFGGEMWAGWTEVT